MWVFVLDDYVERRSASVGELDELFARCNAVVHTGKRDDSHPLTASLSGWQEEAAELPAYPALATVVGGRVRRRTWTATGTTGSRLGAGTGRVPPGITGRREHLATSTAVPSGRCTCRGGSPTAARVVGPLDMLLPALDDAHFGARLANDLGTISRERDQPGQNNILMYDG